MLLHPWIWWMYFGSVWCLKWLDMTLVPRGMYQVQKCLSTTPMGPPEGPQGGPKHGWRCHPRQRTGAGSEVPPRNAPLTRGLLPQEFWEAKIRSLPRGAQPSLRFGRDDFKSNFKLKKGPNGIGYFGNFGDSFWTPKKELSR